MDRGQLMAALERALRNVSGQAVLHSEADDEANDVRRDIEVNYKEEIKRSSKERKSGTGMGGMGMMGGGMMGGGMMGGMGGPR